MTAPVSLKEYFAAAGSAFTKADAETIGSQLEVMAETGPIDQRTIVDTARSTNSPLHRYFEWDDVKAADQHRLTQAGTMMRSIRVRTVEDGRPRVTSAYKLVAKPATPRPEPKGYNRLSQESSFAARMSVAAYDDLMAWRAKYGSYATVWVDFATTFRQVVNQIGEFEDVGRPNGIDHETDEAITALFAWQERFGALTPRWEDIAEQVRFMGEAIDVAAALFAKSGPKERSCLRCGLLFRSAGLVNRQCERCCH